MRRANIPSTIPLALDEKNSESHLLLGYVRLRQNHVDQALESFPESQRRDTHDTVSLCMVGYVLEKLGRPTEATRFYARTLQMKPGDEMASKLMASIDLNDQGE